MEVDGQRLTYTTKGSIHVACEITESRVNVNFQTSGGHDLLISASPQNGNWLGTIAVKPGGGKLVQYGASLPTDAAKFGIEAGALSFEGTVNRLENFDPKTSKDVQAKLAVNCVSAGGDPSAEIGGKSYVFPANGAQSFSCEVSPTTLDVRVNRLALEKLQLELSARIQSGKWLGTITVYTGDDRISSLIPDDGEGLLIDGQSVKYAGKFIRTSRTDKSVKEELAGTVTVTCP